MALGLGAVGVVGALAAGCDATDDSAPPQDQQPPADADSALVARVIGSLHTAAALAQATGTAAPDLAPTARRLTQLHERHARELGDTSDPPRRSVKGKPARLLARLERTEQRLQKRLVSAAMDAESGALAQLFASMAAAVAQQRARIA